MVSKKIKKIQYLSGFHVNLGKYLYKRRVVNKNIYEYFWLITFFKTLRDSYFHLTYNINNRFPSFSARVIPRARFNENCSYIPIFLLFLQKLYFILIKRMIKEQILELKLKVHLTTLQLQQKCHYCYTWCNSSFITYNFVQMLYVICVTMRQRESISSYFGFQIISNIMWCDRQ